MLNSKVLGRIGLIDDDKQTINHFALTGDGGILALARPTVHSKSQYGYLLSGHVDKAHLRRIDVGPQLESALHGEMLSVAVDGERHVAAVTNPESENVLFVDLTKGSLLDWMPCHTLSVAFDDVADCFISSHLKIARLDTKNKKVLPIIPLPPAMFAASAHSLVI
ncbi:MAG: DUF1513 domain-containing protein [Alphaproteobacteria bacterium]|nr:DUF1513 domain-containing protein [Alphaproteobacteria bacterium]